MEKLQLKHIAPYLPYGLKCQCRDLGILELTSVSTINKDYQCWFESALDYNNRDFNYGILSRNSECGIGFNLDKIKPLLHPMSDLYKEIDGKVGIVELAKIADGDDCWTLGDKPFFEINSDSVSVGYARRNAGSYGFLEFSMFNGEFIIHRNGYNKLFINNPIRLFTYLFQHHYDIYGLIDKGLAIDLNSISHE